MFIHARRGLPFSVDVQTLYDGNPTSLNGTALSWLGEAFSPALKMLDLSEGLVRYTATEEDTSTWTAGTHQTLFRYRAAINGSPNKQFYVYLQVHEENDVITLPDTHDHFGYLGTEAAGDDFSFVFTGSADSGGGIPGTDGWSPLFSIEADGARRVLKLVGWTGGSGASPGYVGFYVGASTFVSAIASGVDIRGPAGPAGANGADGVGATANSFQTVLLNGVTSLVADSPTDTLNINATTGISVTGDTTTDTLTINNTGVTSLVAGTGMSVTPSTGVPVVTNTGVLTVNGASGTVVTPNAFGTVVAGGTSLVADSTSDTLTITGSGGISIVSNAATDTMTLVNGGVLTVNGAAGAVTTPNLFGTIVFGGTPLVADSTNDTATISAGLGISLVGNAGADSGTITNAGVLSMNGSTGNVFTPNLFGTVVAGATSLVADSTNDTLIVTAGSGVTITGNAATDTLTVSSLGPSKSYAYVSSTAQSFSSSLSYTFLTGQSIVVPPGARVHIDAQVLYRLTSSSNGLYYGFHLTQGGTLVTDGPDVSWGSFRIDGHSDGYNAYSTAQAVYYKVNYLGVAAGSVDVQANLLQSFVVPADQGSLVARATMGNNGTGNLTVQMFCTAEVNGSSVSVEKGSSFAAHVFLP